MTTHDESEVVIDVAGLRHVYAVTFDATGERLAVGGLGAVLVVDLRSRSAETFPLGIAQPSDAGAARYLAFDSQGQTLFVSTQQRAATGPSSGVFCVGLAARSISVVLSSEGAVEFGALDISTLGDVAIAVGGGVEWILADGSRHAHAFEPPASPATNLRFRRDGACFAAAAGDHLWLVDRFGGVFTATKLFSIQASGPPCVLHISASHDGLPSAQDRRGEKRVVTGPLMFDSTGQRLACVVKHEGILVCDLSSNAHHVTGDLRQETRPLWFDADLGEMLDVDRDGVLARRRLGAPRRSRRANLGRLGSADVPAEIAASPSGERVAYRLGKTVRVLSWRSRSTT